MDASATLPDLAWAYDEPFGDSSALPTFHVARLTRQHVTVALSGDGGDEAFAGYERYAAGVLASRLSPVARLPVVRTLGNALFRSGRQAPTRTMRRALQRLWEGLAESNAATRYTAWMTIARERQLASLYREPYRPSESAGRYLQHIYDTPNGRLAALDRMQRLDILTYLPEDLLVKVDRASMANSLEVRAPFLDHHVMEFAASLPASLRLPGLRLKSLLKRAFAPELPRSTRRRRKRGFGVPISAWFRRELHRDLEQMVLARDARISAYLRQDTIRQWLAEHRAGTVDHAPLLWSLLMLEHWQRTHLG
jgi:asparagine synthase (glutamine-hydrolysing)